jgi:hypothetical protein
VEGIRPWQVYRQAVYDALLSGRETWRRGDLGEVCGLESEKLDEILFDAGAIELSWDPPRPALSRPLDRRYPLSGARIRLVPDGPGLIHNELNAGRPESVICTFLWEGWDNAVAVWQAKRREKAWKRGRPRI